MTFEEYFDNWKNQHEKYGNLFNVDERLINPKYKDDWDRCQNALIDRCDLYQRNVKSEMDSPCHSMRLSAITMMGESLISCMIDLKDTPDFLITDSFHD